MGSEGVYCFYEDALPEWGIPYILLAEDSQGDIFYPARPVIEMLGVQRNRQMGIIQQDSRIRGGVREILAPTRGGKQKTIYVRKRELAIYLSIIDPDNVGEGAKGRVTDVQEALWHLAEKIAFKRTRGVAAGVGGPTAVVGLSGTQTATIPCPNCGELLVAEIEHGELHLTHK